MKTYLVFPSEVRDHIIRLTSKSGMVEKIYHLKAKDCQHAFVLIPSADASSEDLAQQKLQLRSALRGITEDRVIIETTSNPRYSQNHFSELGAELIYHRPLPISENI